MTAGAFPQIPGYRIERKLGQGAMATVYLATHLALDRQVALKIMEASLTDDEESRQRFHAEGKIIAKIDHPNVVRIYDIGVYHGNFFMAMEYIEGGRTLKEEILESRTGVPPSRSAEVIKTMASALNYAHQLGYVHRDIKPTNILIRRDGSPVLTDFGIAKMMDRMAEATLTKKGWAIGTPSYMSPEQAKGDKVDSRTDTYSLGVMFFELLTGDKPYKAGDAFAIAAMHVNAPLPKLPKELAAFQPIINKMMAKQPAERYATVDQVVADLDTVISKPKPVAAAAAPSRRPVVASAAAALALMGAMLYLTLFRQGETIQQPRVELTAEQREQVGNLLVMAGLYKDAGRLVDPPISNAVYALYEVLAIDPQEERALKMLDEIAAHYREQAEAALKRGEDKHTVEQLIEFGLQARQDDEVLKELLSEVRAR